MDWLKFIVGLIISALLCFIFVALEMPFFSIEIITALCLLITLRLRNQRQYRSLTFGLVMGLIIAHIVFLLLYLALRKMH